MSARVERMQTTTWTLHLSNEEFHQLHAVAPEGNLFRARDSSGTPINSIYLKEQA